VSDLFKNLLRPRPCQRTPCDGTIFPWMVTLGPDPMCCYQHYTDAERTALDAAMAERDATMRLREVEPACWSWEVPEPREYASEEEARTALSEWQFGRGCAICGPGWDLVDDHDHQTGLIRGRLCGSCNVKEGWGNDTPPFTKYRERGPAVILGVKVRYWSSFTGYAEAQPVLSPEELAAETQRDRDAVDRLYMPAIDEL
jgi:hypothetical protein